MRLAAMAGTASFAHLLGRGKAVNAKRAEDEDKKRAKRAEDLDEEKGDGDDEGDGPKDGEGKRAESPEREEDDDEREERDEEDDDRKAKKAKGKRASEEDGEDDDEEGDDGSDSADMRKRGSRAARLRERARCAAIFADAAAGKNPALAAQLAFATDLSRSQAIAVLRTGGLAAAPRHNTLDERMAAVKTPPVGAGDAAAPSGQKSLAAQIVEAGRKRRGEV